MVDLLPYLTRAQIDEAHSTVSTPLKKRLGRAQLETGAPEARVQALKARA